MNGRSSLRQEFLTLMNDCDRESSSMDIVYKDMTRKLCNIRIQEFLSSRKQRFASEKGQASTSGQNLCDTLLTLHTNLQSQINKFSLLTITIYFLPYVFFFRGTQAVESFKSLYDFPLWWLVTTCCTKLAARAVE